MKKLLCSLAALVILLSLVGCGGQSSSSTQQTAPGLSAITFSIPLQRPGSHLGGPLSRSGAAAASTKPAFIDPSANGTLVTYLDGNQAMSLDFGCIDWSSNEPVLTPSTCMNGSASGIGTGGSSITWNSSITGQTLSISAALSTVANVSHTFGAVQTNGSCVPGYGGCIPGNSGYVLSEGQIAFTPSSGNNAALTLTLAGVLQSGYLCNVLDTTGCSTFPGPVGTDSYYHYIAFPTDENGSPVIPMVAPGSWTPYLTTRYDNGGWQIVETDNLGILDIQADGTAQGGVTLPNGGSLNSTGNIGPFTTANAIQMPGGLWWDGQGIKIGCKGTGTAHFAMEMVPTSATKGNVTPFTYQTDNFSGTYPNIVDNGNGNYPAAGAPLGSIGATQWWGNGEGVAVNCTADQPITIQ